MTYLGNDNPLLRLHCIMETPVLDERKWAKVPTSPTDGVLIDMEDTVAQARKIEGREAVVRSLANAEYFGDRMLLSRPNGLDTEWGVDDTIALAKAGAENVLLPMVTGPADVLEYQRIFHDHDADPNLLPTCETPGAVANVEALAALDRVTGFAFGEGDLTAYMGLQIFEPDGSLNPLLSAARARVYLAAAGTNCAVFDIPFLHDLKDLHELRTRGSQLARMGATGLFALYPPHADVINEIYAPDPEAVENARTIVEVYEKAAADGKPAVQLPNGKAVLIHDYKKAQGLLSRANG